MTKLYTYVGRFSKPTGSLPNILDKFKQIDIELKEAFKDLTRKDYRDIIIEPLNTEGYLTPTYLKLFSRFARKLNLYLYCREVLVPGYLTPEKEIYLIGPRKIGIVYKAIIKYLIKSIDICTQQKSIEITRNLSNYALKTYYIDCILMSINQKVIGLPNKPFYTKFIRAYMLNELLFPVPSYQLSSNPKWLRTVKLKKPRFKDRHLI